ncbi:MAG: hypothetical protein ACOC47_06615 [Alkalispirochaetaceae bacterium]
MRSENNNEQRSAEEAARLLRERIEYLRQRDLLRLVEDQLREEKRQQKRETYRWN